MIAVTPSENRAMTIARSRGEHVLQPVRKAVGRRAAIYVAVGLRGVGGMFFAADHHPPSSARAGGEFRAFGREFGTFSFTLVSSSAVFGVALGMSNLCLVRFRPAP